MKTGLYSTFVLVPKKTRDLRPVINLRPLNRYLRKQHCKMDCLSKVLNLVQHGDWAISFDLADAYLQIPIHVKFRKFVRFHILVHLHVLRSNRSAQNVHEINSSNRSSSKNAERPSGSLPGRLDLSKSVETSTVARQRENTQSPRHTRSYNQIGKISLNSKPESNIYRGSVSVGQRNCLSNIRENLENRASYFIDYAGTNSPRFFPSSGFNGFLIELIPNARRYMRAIQLHLLHFWRPVTREQLQAIIPVTQHLIDHLQWWKVKENLLKRKFFSPKTSIKILTTDAS